MFGIYRNRIKEMNIGYTEETLTLFANPKYVYELNEQHNVFGSFGDADIGEYVNLYFQVETNTDYAESKILKARFSAVGNVITIAATEYLCSMIEGLTFNQALGYFTVDKLQKILKVPEDRLHSIGFIVQAFYNALEKLSHYA